MDFFEKFKTLETNSIYGKKEEPFIMPKTWTPQFAFKLAKQIFQYLGEKYPCPKCEGHATTATVGDGYDYSERWCEKCDGTGIYLPESEA